MTIFQSFFAKIKKPIQSKKIPKLTPAKKAWEEAKTPQIINAITAINDAKKKGTFKTYICNQEKPCDELLNIILAAGYDIHIHAFNHDKKAEIFTQVFFDENASGKLTFENTDSKRMFPSFNDNDYDVYEKND